MKLILLNKYPVIFIAFLLSAKISFVQTMNYKYDDSWGKEGYSILNENSRSIRVGYSMGGFSINAKSDGENDMHEVIMSRICIPSEEGSPNLPGYGRYIAIPQGAIPQLKIVSARVDSLFGLEIAPAMRIPLESDNASQEIIKNKNIYEKNEYYPSDPIQLSEVSQIRGVDVVMLGITPFQYNPQSKVLRVYRDIEIEISFVGGTGDLSNYGERSLWWDQILANCLLNYESLPKYDYNKQLQERKDNSEYEYVIITPNDQAFINKANEIKEFRTQQGIYTGVVALSEIGLNLPSTIEDYINTAYNNAVHKPVAILLLGDYGSNANFNIQSPTWSSYCVSDNKYADINGDNLPDLIISRIAANNSTELNVMVDKFINYESNPPANESFYKHPVTALGWQTSRWFQICSEVIGGFWSNELGKDPVRINAVYEGNPNNDPWSTAPNTNHILEYFGPNGNNYIPSSPTELGGWNGGNASDVNNAINNGAFMVQHRDHGIETGWGEPNYKNPDVNGLTNTDLTFVFSVNCLTGKFTQGECFAEKMHRYTHNGQLSGALGLIAASQTSFSFVNDAYVWGMYDNMWPDFMPDYGTEYSNGFIRPAFASVAGKFFLQASSWPSNPDKKNTVYHLFHHHGDAFLNVYSEVPQQLSVECDKFVVSNAENIEVSVEEGSFVALTMNGDILGTAVTENSKTNVPISGNLMPGDHVLVTITKQNYFRYTDSIAVVPSNQPYVILDDFAINDEQTNNNSQAEYGETFSLDVSLKNISNEFDANNVTAIIRTNDVYVENINDSIQNFGVIEAGSIETEETSFNITLADNVPDQYIVVLDLLVEAENGYEWNYSIPIVVNAPEFAITGYEIDDLNGNNNGLLDPGETVNVVYSLGNNGHASVSNITSHYGFVLPSSNIEIISAHTDPLTLNCNESTDLIYTVQASETSYYGLMENVKVEINAGFENQYHDSLIDTLVVGLVHDYCEAYGVITTDEFIENVSFAEINNSSVPGDGYTDFTDISTDVIKGETYTLAITNGEYYNGDQVGCWIDWNYDGDFDDANETIEMEFSSKSAKTATCQITIPVGAIVGSTRMRARVMHTGALSACGSSTHGEVEDYQLNILDMPHGTLVATEDSICFGSSTGELKLEDYSSPVVSWQKKHGSDEWQVIECTDTVYSEIPTLTGTWFYRVNLEGGINSNEDSLIVVPAPIGGVVSGATDIFLGEEIPVLSLTGYQGSVEKWQRKINNGEWEDIIHNLPTYQETPSDTGMHAYRVVVSGLDLCEVVFSDSAVLKVKTPISINEYNKLGLIVYPNPAEDFVNIESNFEIANIKIVNSTGDVVDDWDKQAYSAKLDLRCLVHGIYYVVLTSKDGITNTIKVFKE